MAAPKPKKQDNPPEGEGAMLPNPDFDNVVKALMRVPPKPRIAKPKGKKKPA